MIKFDKDHKVLWQKLNKEEIPEFIAFLENELRRYAGERSASLTNARWIYPLEKGIVEGRHCSPAGQEVYKVKLETDNITYTFASSEIDEVE